VFVYELQDLRANFVFNMVCAVIVLRLHSSWILLVVVALVEVLRSADDQIDCLFQL
jgi:hypothetical protein